MHKYSGKVRRAVLRSIFVGMLAYVVSTYLGGLVASRGFGNKEFNAFIVFVAATFAYGAYGVHIARSYFKRQWEERVKRLNETAQRQALIFKDEPALSNLEVSDALERIVATSGEDAAAIRTALIFSSRLKPHPGLQLYIERLNRRKGIFSGLTNLGTFAAPDQATVTKSSGNVIKERIGQFKVWRDERSLFFHHYWKADPQTATNLLDVFCGQVIVFDPNTMAYRGYGYMEPQRISRHAHGSQYKLVVTMEHGPLKGRSDNYGDILISGQSI